MKQNEKLKFLRDIQDGKVSPDEIIEKALKITQVKEDREKCLNSFYYFFQKFWPVIVPDQLIDAAHIRVLCDELQEVGFRVKNREPKKYDVVINIPPGTSKSTICTIMFPVWLWTIDPSLRVITGSYSDTLATEHSVKSRDIIRSEEFKELFPEIELKQDADNKTLYQNTKTGARVATSVGGTITGQHAHVIIVDDPINPKQAASEAERNSANDWMDRTLSTRKVDKEVTVTILVMQRLHEQDPTGNILSKEGKKLKHICLPAELMENVSPAELREIYKDGLLDPVRLSRVAIDDSRANLGSIGYANQFLQIAAPEGGALIKQDWLPVKPWSAFTQEVNGPIVWNFYADLAYTAKTSNDPSALFACTFHNGYLYVRDVQSKWLEFPQLVKWIPEFCMKNGYTDKSKIYIEGKASGKSVIQELRATTGLNVIEDVAPTSDKISRVNGITAKLESGRVVLLQGDYIKSFIQECIFFPNGKNDDKVDCLTMAVSRELSTPRYKKTRFNF